MSTSHIQRLHKVDPPGGHKVFIAPAMRIITPETAREMLLRHSDPNDPEVKFMLDCIERLRYAKHS